MTGRFKGRTHRDTETAAETVIFNTDFHYPVEKVKKGGLVRSITEQLTNTDNFDTYVEKRTKRQTKNI